MTRDTLIDLKRRVNTTDELDDRLFIDVAMACGADPMEARLRALIAVRAWENAALCLVERVLPGWCWGLFDDGTAWLWPTTKRDLLSGYESRCKSPALGIICSMLSALIAQASETEGVKP
jgi:hypothetical protein